MSKVRRNKRQNQKMLEKLQKEQKSTETYKQNVGFFTDLQTENQMLNLLYTQKKLLKGINGGILERILNYFKGINPLIQIMYDRSKLLESLKELNSHEPIDTKSRPGTGKADTT